MATANLVQTSVSGGTQNALALQGDGVFFPKASTVSRLALTLTTTDKGFIVYDTTDNNIYLWNGSAWESIPSSGDAGANGSVQYNDAGVVSGASNFFWDKATGNVGLSVAPTGTFYSSSETRIVVKGLLGSYAGTVGVESKGTTNLTKGLFTAADNINEVAVGSITNSPLNFYTNNALKATLDTSGNFTVSLGNVIIGTSGRGIDFSAHPQAPGATSEILNDYEEGTWTIGLTFGGGNTGLTTALNTGRYTKVGRQVTVCGRLELSNKGSSTGAAAITGLPFSIASGNDSQQAASFRFNGVSYTGAFQGYGALSSTSINLEQISEAGSPTDITDSNFSNGTSIQISFTYTI